MICTQGSKEITGGAQPFYFPGVDGCKALVCSYVNVYMDMYIYIYIQVHKIDRYMMTYFYIEICIQINRQINDISI